MDDDTGKIIRLQPTAQKRPSTKVDPSKRLFTGAICFTCPECKTEARADFSKMVFRTIDFYCGSCGTYHKVINPAFSSSSS